ncbi:MAG: RNA polymerase sigma factor [Marinifilaceae bacterium]
MAYQFNNKSAFEEIFKKYYPDLVDSIFCQLGDREIAKDMAQDIFIKLYESKCTFKSISNLRGWLYQCANNACIDYFRAMKIRENHSTLIAEYLIFINEPYVEVDGVLTAKIKRALDLLPKHCRLIIRMNIEENKKYKDIANELNISINTVRKQVSRGYSKLRAYLNHNSSSFILYCALIKRNTFQ